MLQQLYNNIINEGDLYELRHYNCMYHNPVSLPVKNCLRPPIKTLTNSGGSAKSKKKLFHLSMYSRI